jgi:hypothetical protein
MSLFRYSLSLRPFEIPLHSAPQAPRRLRFLELRAVESAGRFTPATAESRSPLGDLGWGACLLETGGGP